MIMSVFESDYNRKQGWINLKYVIKHMFFVRLGFACTGFFHTFIAVEKLLMILTF